MSRGLSTNQNNYLAGNSLISGMLIHIGINGGTDKRYTDLPFDITYDGNTYEAQGVFLNVSEANENSSLTITNINIGLSAIDVTDVQTFAVSSQVNQNVSIYRVFLDPTNNQLIGDSTGDRAVLIFKGKIAGYRVTNNIDSANIQFTVSSQFQNFDRTTGRRTNNASLQKEHSNDYGFEYAHESLRDIKWGKK